MSCYCYKSVLRAYLTALHCHISIYHDAQEDPRPMILHTLKSHAILAQQNCRRRSLIAWFYFNRKQPHARVVMPMVSELHSTTT
jgi:hypothetical protein